MREKRKAPVAASRAAAEGTMKAEAGVGNEDSTLEAERQSMRRLQGQPS